MTNLNRPAGAAAPDATAPALPATALGLTGYFFIGTAAVLVPSVMPFITSEYMATGLTLAAIGLIFPAPRRRRHSRQPLGRCQLRSSRLQQAGLDSGARAGGLHGPRIRRPSLAAVSSPALP